MTHRHRYFDRTGRELSRAEALKDGNVLRDGVSLRVSMHGRDSAPRGADGRSFWDARRDSLVVVDPRRVGAESGSRPGFRVSDSPINRQAIIDAYADYRRDIELAWRNPPPDAAFGSYPLSAGEGSPCTINGAAGILTRAGDALVCKPVGARADAAKPPRDPEEEDDDDENGDDEDDGETTADARSVDQIAHDHSVAMERVYAARNREISDAWREGKDNK